MLKVQEIREIIKLIDESSIQEFEYESGESKVTLKKQGGVAPAPAAPTVANTEVQQTPAPAPAAPQKEEAPVREEESPSPEAAVETSGEKTVDYDYEITSPMVGTIYHAPSPEDDPYVQAGDKVSDDSVVCIVEAMKLFNEIEAEVSGEIVEVLVSDGELVEYNQPLFRVKR